MSNESNFYKPFENLEVVTNNISFLEPHRFDLIYFLSQNNPSWKVIGVSILGKPITEQEYSFVLSKTRKGSFGILLSNHKEESNNQIKFKGGILIVI